ncbi:MAG: DNA repair protein RecN [Gammaproteobacteria bacterium]|nr:DNA repair protein RecN [Gammaproteobacteria bacterium]
MSADLWTIDTSRQAVLKSLTVRDFALVQSLEIQFGSGLTVITGESGAGKSILLGALGLVLGDRAATDTIRPGANRADVSAEFDLSGSPAALDYLVGLALDDPDQPGRCLLRRVVNADGRSRAFLNGTPVNLQVLRELSASCIDVHGQHEHQRLAQREVQLALLDEYGVARSLLDDCRKAHQAWQATLTNLAALEESVASQQDRAALLDYQLSELSSAAPQPGEFREVERSHKRLNQVQSLKEAVAACLSELATTSALNQGLRQLERIDDDHPALQGARETLAAALALSDDAERDLRTYAETLESDPQALQILESRMSQLHELARKHHIEPEALPELIENLQRELETISTDASKLAELRAQVETQRDAYQVLAGKVSEQRHHAADDFTTAVSACLNTLGIDGGALALEFSDAENATGLETVEFLCVTNPNYPAAPLSRIASGGERARISLAIEVVAAKKCALPTLVLDEADVGVGGTAADVVGRLLRTVAEHTQVICITHAPQVAALGEHHLLVHKDNDRDTQIAPLVDAERIDELARMLAGAGITDKSRDYARTLLSEARDIALH